MAITLKHAVIHELVKEQHEPIQDSRLRTTVLPADNQSIIKLVEGVIGLYGRKNNSAQYGVFRQGEGQGLFPSTFADYEQLPDVSDAAFLAASTVAMTELYKRAESEKLASGGYILFADYVDENEKRYFLVAMVKQKPGYRISGNLTIEDLEYIDLSRLHQAARISFTKYIAYGLADEVDKHDINYLSFVSPSNQKKAAGYFVLALGCQAGAPSAKATKALVTESVAFFKKDEALKAHAPALKQKLQEYLAEKEEKKESVKLSEVEKIARAYFPADDEDKAEQLADSFVSHLNSDDVGVPFEFMVNKAKLRQMTHISYKDDNMTLLFDRDDLGKTPDAKIYFSEDKLIISDLPEELKNQIEAHFKGD